MERSSVLTIIEPGVRQKCEDISFSQPYEDGIVMAVFDGHNGVEIAKYCSDNLMTLIQKFNHIHWNERLYYVVMELQNLVSGLPYSFCGTTAVITYINKLHEIYVACIGDCRAIVMDTNTGEVMKLDGGEIVVRDMMEEEFSKNDIKTETSNNEYITRSHCYTGVKNCDSEYYSKIQNIKFICMNGAYYANFPGLQMEPLRAIGDTHAKELIRKPELYYWRLNRKQIDNATLLLMSDGFENHDVFTPNKLTAFLKDPIVYLNDPSTLTDGIFIKKFGYISDSDIKSSSALEVIKNIYSKISTLVKKDKEWYNTLTDAMAKFEEIYKSFNGTIKTNPKKTMELSVYLSILLGSDDNITLMVADLELPA